MRYVPRGRKLKTLIGCLIVLGAIQIGSFASGWSTTFPDNQPIILSAITSDLDAGGVPIDPTSVVAHRGPIVGGTCTVTATVSSINKNDLVRIEFQTADDINGNNIIEPNEWTIAASANSGSDGAGGTVASTVASGISVGHAAYRIAHFWTWGSSSDTVYNVGLTVQ